MKKIILISVFIIGLMPHIQKGGLHFCTSNTAFGQNYASEKSGGGSPSCYAYYKAQTAVINAALTQAKSDCDNACGYSCLLAIDSPCPPASYALCALSCQLICYKSAQSSWQQNTTSNELTYLQCSGK